MYVDKNEIVSFNLLPINVINSLCACSDNFMLNRGNSNIYVLDNVLK